MPHTKLIPKICEGDRAAQLELYDLYSKELYNTAYRIVKDSFTAEEIMQDTLIKLFKNPTPYISTPQKLLFSLKRITINAAIDHLRIKKIKFEDIEQPTTQNKLQHIENDPEIYTEQNLKILTQAISTLPLGYQTILNLKIIEEFSTQEIAQQLKITPTTVRTQLLRAKSKLKQMLK